MQDKIDHIESIYQSHINMAIMWRLRALNDVYNEYSLPFPNPSSPPPIIANLNWKIDNEILKDVHRFIVKEKLINQQNEDFIKLFQPHFYEGSLVVSKIICKNIKKILWIFFILEQIRVINKEPLYKILPQHFLDRKKNKLNSETLETYLSEIRRLYEKKKFPDFIQDFILLFPSKGLPKSLLKE